MAVPPIGKQPPGVTGPSRAVGVAPSGVAPANAVTLPPPPVTHGRFTSSMSWVAGALWRTLLYPAIYAASVLVTPEAQEPPAMTDAEANVWRMPLPLRDYQLGIARNADHLPLRTRWHALLRTDFSSPAAVRAHINTLLKDIYTPHTALAINTMLYNRATHAGWSASEIDEFIDIVHDATTVVLERFNADMANVHSEDAAQFTASAKQTYLPGTSTSTGRPLGTRVDVPAGFTRPRPSRWSCQAEGATSCELATTYGHTHARLMQEMYAERDTLAGLFEEYLTWAEEAGVAAHSVEQTRGDYVRLFQRVFPAHLARLITDLHIDEVELRLAAMAREFRHESRGLGQALTDQLQFWRMAGGYGEIGHFIVLLLLLDGTFIFGGAFRRQRLEARLAPLRLRLETAQQLMSAAQTRVDRAAQRLRQLMITRIDLLSHGGSDDKQGQHGDPWTEIVDAHQEREVAEAGLAARRTEFEDLLAQLAGDDPRRQHRARRLWRAVQRTGEFAGYQLPWGVAFAVASAMALASVQVATNGDPIPLLDDHARVSWRVK